MLKLGGGTHMKKTELLKKYISPIVLFILFASLALHFPLTGNDLYYANQDSIKNFSSFFDISGGSLVSTATIILLSKYPFLKAMTYGIVCSGLFILMKNIINIKNTSLMYMGIFLFMLIGNQTLAPTLVSLNGFIFNILGVLLTFIILNIFIKDKINKINKILLLFLGIASALVNPYISVLLIILSFSYMLKNKKYKLIYKRTFILFSGLIFGTLVQGLWSINTDIPLFNLEIPHNLLHSIIPSLFSVNFLIVLITVAFLLFFSIKIYLKSGPKNKVLTILSISAITFYALCYLLSTSDILNYIAFILYTSASIYILLHSNNSITFKKKITVYYTVKIAYLLILTFSAFLTPASTILPILIDILIILEIINYVLPNDFMKKSWFIIVSLLLLSEIYIYHTVNEKHDLMNVFIKNHLECGMYEFTIPSKYETEYLYDYVPNTGKNLIEFINYYDVDMPFDGTIKFDFINK